MSNPSSTLSAQLVEQAEHLLRRDRGRPRQGNARRAISAAYYAVFHHLADEAGRVFVGGGSARRALRNTMVRAIDHGSVRSVCDRVAARGAPSSLPSSLRGCWSGPVSTDLADFARFFVELQDSRHAADYDRAVTFRRPEVEQSLDLARKAIAAWSRVHPREAQAFLLAVLAWKNLAAR